MAKHGGKREGAGRKKGSKSKPSILDFWSDDEVEQYFMELKSRYKESDVLMKFVGEQIMGKAPQALTGADGTALFPSKREKEQADKLLVDYLDR